MVSEAEADLKDTITNDDQCFLMYFIIGTYFGPDIKTESATKKSILQRVAEGFPPYTLNQLTNSFIKVVELERVYYYILRNSDKSLILKLSILRRFFQGQGENINYPKFSDLFPPQLHPQSRFKSRHKIIHNIVFINNPDTRYIKSEDVERFKRLTGLQELHVDREAVKLQFGTSFNQNHLLRNSNMLPTGNVNNWSWRGGGGDGGVGSSKSVKDVMPYKRGNTDEEGDDPEKVGGAMLFLPSPPSREELANMVAATKNGIALTGSAAKGQCGPTIGLVDIGECEDSYLFRVSLPGVKRDETEFNCEVAVDGEVSIHGITITGEKTVSRYNHVFKMLTQNLCPPGKFSIRFKLPGPVDPNRFSGNFGTDGVLEGVVMKLKR